MSDFIPKQYKKEPTSIRVPFEKLERIDKLASSYGISRNEFINQCIDYALEHMTPERKEDKKK